MEDLKEEPTTLLEHDFDDSDFNFATFPSDRVVVLSYMLGLPEVFNLWAQISKYGDGSDGVFGIIEFDCDAFNAETPKAAIPRFWVFDGRGTLPSPAQAPAILTTLVQHSELRLPPVDSTRTPPQPVAKVCSRHG